MRAICAGKGGHEWIIEFRELPDDKNTFVEILDKSLIKANSDYEAKRYKDIALEAPIIHFAKQGTFYNWMKNDPEFAEACKVAEEIALDFAESKLHKLIRDENPSSVFFYLKTKGKKRGYIERQEIDQSSNHQIIFENVSKKIENAEEWPPDWENK